MKKNRHNTDIAIIGAGAAGIASAVAAAKLGASVTLIEQDHFVGGLASAAMVGTVCGLFYRNIDTPRYAIKGFARQFAHDLAKKSQTHPTCFAEGLHFLPYHINHFHLLGLQLLQKAGVHVLLQSRLQNIETADQQIKRLHIKTPQADRIIQPSAVIDCSGSARVSKLADIERLTDLHYQSASFVCQVQGLPTMNPRTLSLNIIRWLKRGVQKGDLEPDCVYLSIIPGSINHDQGLFKLGLPCPNGKIDAYLSHYQPIAQQRCVKIIKYLQQSDPLLTKLTLVKMAQQIGIRSSARAKGIEQLTEQHVLACCKPDNGIAVGAWPIEYWKEQGKPIMHYFAMNDCYWIPAGALVSPLLSNLFFAGRALSATELAIASARVIGTCLSTGYAAGMLANSFVQQGSWQSAIDTIQSQQVT